MSITQAVLIALVYYLGRSPFLAGPVGYYTVYRPVIGGWVVGIILGEPVTGMGTPHLKASPTEAPGSLCSLTQARAPESFCLPRSSDLFFLPDSNSPFHLLLSSSSPRNTVLQFSLQQNYNEMPLTAQPSGF